MSVDTKKVIKGLEWCLFKTGCNGCPYRNDCDDGTNMEKDALALLKAQEPRVMTIEELDGLQEDDVVFVEIKPVRDLTCISVELVRFIKKVQDPATWVELHTTDSAGFYMTRKTTEPNWRCWTSCPTEDQMEATPWN